MILMIPRDGQSCARIGPAERTTPAAIVDFSTSRRVFGMYPPFRLAVSWCRLCVTSSRRQAPSISPPDLETQVRYRLALPVNSPYGVCANAISESPVERLRNVQTVQPRGPRHRNRPASQHQSCDVAAGRAADPGTRQRGLAL